MTQTVTQAVAERERTPAAPSPREMLRDLLQRNTSAVGASLPTGYDRERFVRLLLTAANTNPELFECDPRSFLAAGVGAAQLGLEPNDPRGLRYLVPFTVRGRKVVQLIIGYRGMLDLARRSGLVSSINVFPVYDGDQFTYRLGLHPTLDHVPHPDSDEDPGKLTHVYAVATVGNSVMGDKQFVVLTRRQVDKVRDQYARSKLSPWHTHYVEMALKTALRRLCKWLPQTVELASAVERDDTELSITDFALPAGHSFDPGTDEAIEAGTSEQASDAEPSGDSGDQPLSQSGRRRRAASASDTPPPADSPDDQLTLPE